MAVLRMRGRARTILWALAGLSPRAEHAARYTKLARRGGSLQRCELTALSLKPTAVIHPLCSGLGDGQLGCRSTGLHSRGVWSAVVWRFINHDRHSP